MITIKNKLSIQKMDVAGKLLAGIMAQLSDIIKPGQNTLAIDSWIDAQLRASGLVSQTKGYHGYRHASCISINDEVVHGVPRHDKIISVGDLVKVDICAAWKGYCADMARCFFVGDVSNDVKQLAHVASSALNCGIAQAYPGNKLSDISAAIQHEIERHGYGVVVDFAGHGIGRRMHEDPEILNYGKPGRGPVLRSGMTFAIEPMLTQGSYKVYVIDDGWTVKTVDKSWAAHVEDTVLITDHGPRVLTRLDS